MEARAVVKYVRTAPRKVRLVADIVRGKKVEDALHLLSFTPKAGAKIVTKVIKSAVANAVQKKAIDVDTLFVKSILIDGGPSLKRIRPRPMGRANKILKRTSHITVILEES
ncbi:MAG TPA: 50S ribosomal protein L22 [Thermodesulfobacteriota bacterium]|nr:50S ribosomal protein L22 [Thermodesulfobacteriota bacterium]